MQTHNGLQFQEEAYKHECLVNTYVKVLVLLPYLGLQLSFTMLLIRLDVQYMKLDYQEVMNALTCLTQNKVKGEAIYVRLVLLGLHR